MDSPLFYALLTDTDLPTFEVASDAFLSYKARASVLLRAAPLSAARHV
jgi:hypothetical protein